MSNYKTIVAILQFINLPIDVTYLIFTIQQHSPHLKDEEIKVQSGPAGFSKSYCGSWFLCLLVPNPLSLRTFQ